MNRILTHGFDQLTLKGCHDKFRAFNKAIAIHTKNRIQINLDCDLLPGKYKGYAKQSLWIIPVKLPDSKGYKACFNGIEAWYTPMETSLESFKHHGNFELIMHGQKFKKISLYEQWRLFVELSSRFQVTSMHLKCIVQNPVKSIDGIRDVVKLGSSKCRLSSDVIGYKSGKYISSNTKLSTHGASKAIYFPKDNAEKRLIIYDPYEMHGELNSQHWELRLSGRYMNHALFLLNVCASEDEFSSMIKSIVFGSIDFRHGHAKHLNRRERHKWYEQLIVGIEPIQLKQNKTFDKHKDNYAKLYA